MSAPVETVVAFTALPAAALVASGVAAVVRPPGPTARSAIQHFAAGVVFAVVAIELLPDVRREHRPWEVGLAFALGVAVMLGLRRLTRPGGGRERAASGGGWPWGLLVAVGVDVMLDGILLGIGFSAGAEEGTLLGVGLAAEYLSLGLATAATVRKGNGARWRALAATGGLAAAFLVGTGGGS